MTAVVGPTRGQDPTTSEGAPVTGPTPDDTAALRIGLVTHRFAPSTGGVETHVEQLARALARAGQRPQVFTHDLGHGAPPVSRHEGVTVRRYRRLVRWDHGSISPPLLFALRRGRIPLDVVHVHSYHDPVSALAAGSWSGPLVVTPHYHRSSADGLRDLMHRGYRPLAGRGFADADSVIAVSGAEASLLAEDFPAIASRLHVIGNGIDRSRFADVPADATLRGARTVVVAGRLEAYKGVDRLLAAASELDPADVLHVVGDGPDRSRLESLVSRDGATVRFWGRTDDATYASLLASADVVASASSHEAQGISALEGLTCGAALVLSDIGAFRDIERDHDGRVHIVVDDSPVGWAAAIRSMAARPRAPRAVPDWDDVAAAMVERYRAALAAHLPG